MEPKRGAIYDDKGRILALNKDIESIYAVSKDITPKEEVSGKLSKALNIDKSLVYNRLKKDKSFVWIKRAIRPEEARLVRAMNIKGIEFVNETKRFYPNDSLGCHFIGFTDIDSQGLDGLELYYNNYLKGEYGWKKALVDAKRTIIDSSSEYLPPKEGYGLVLTIDEAIQHILEKETSDIAAKYKPKGVMIIAMDPHTGSLLGMASYPNFNLNSASRTAKPFLRNKCVTDCFEPGSIFKIVTASAVLNEHLVKFDDTFYCENGFYRIGKRILKDHTPHGKLTFREVIEKSSNIGTVKAASRLGDRKLYDYIEQFGFGKISGLDLPGEENGIVRDVSTWTYTDMTTVPMGQGISCTPLQLACAVSVIANGGDLMKPYIVSRIVDKDQNVIKTFEPEKVRSVISEETSDRMKDLLKGAIERGTGKKAKLSGYTAAGKTGTAQKVDATGRYSKDKYLASFVGFAPLRDPRVALAICVDEPKGAYFGGSVAAPAFKNIMNKLLRYLEVPKDDKDA